MRPERDVLARLLGQPPLPYKRQLVRSTRGVRARNCARPEVCDRPSGRAVRGRVAGQPELVTLGLAHPWIQVPDARPSAVDPAATVLAYVVGQACAEALWV